MSSFIKISKPDQDSQTSILGVNLTCRGGVDQLEILLQTGRDFLNLTAVNAQETIGNTTAFALIMHSNYGATLLKPFCEREEID